jgi:hypothetical protein
MYRIFLLLISFSLQAFGQQQVRFNEKYLLGYWTGISTKDNSYPIEGLSFYANHSFENKLGFFKKVDDNRIFLGTKSKFKITKGTLLLSYPGVKTWEKAKILILNRHSLQFSLKGVIFDFVRAPYIHPSTLTFDKIIVSTSGCYDGSCPVSNTTLSADGSVIFRGVQYTSKKGVFGGAIPKEKYKQILNDFNEANLNTLQASYRSSASDQETITTTFIINGRIYKTVSDYGGAAPYLFKSAYIQLMYLYQSVSLKAISKVPH